MPYPTAPSSSSGPQLDEQELPQEWSELTERIELPQSKQAFAGFGETQVLKLERVGCVAEAQVLITLKFKTKAAEEATPSIGMPWRVLKKLAIEANGVAGIISAGGTILESRQKVVYRNPPHAVLANAHSAAEKIAAATEVTWEWVVQVPVAEDLRELEGIILSQSEETALGISLTWATEGEVFSAGKVELVSGSISWGTTLFSIGTMVEGKRKVVVLPDLTAFHGLVERSVPLGGEGEQESPLTRTSGDMLRYFLTTFNGNNAQFDPLEYTTFFIQFGGNQKPIAYGAPKLLVERNARDYLGRPDVNGVHYLVVDTMLDDPLRDAVRPMALSELKAVVGIPANPNANSRIASAQETIYPVNA